MVTMAETSQASNWLERYGTYISLLLLSSIMVDGNLQHLWSEGGSFVEGSVTKTDD